MKTPHSFLKILFPHLCLEGRQETSLKTVRCPATFQTGYCLSVSLSLSSLLSFSHSSILFHGQVFKQIRRNVLFYSNSGTNTNTVISRTFKSKLFTIHTTQLHFFIKKKLLNVPQIQQYCIKLVLASQAIPSTRLYLNTERQMYSTDSRLSVFECSTNTT